MCLAVPLEIKEIKDNETAVVKQGETEIDVNISMLENPKPGDFIIVHAGFAIEIIDLKEAGERIRLIGEMHSHAW